MRAQIARLAMMNLCATIVGTAAFSTLTRMPAARTASTFSRGGASIVLARSPLPLLRMSSNSTEASNAALNSLERYKVQVISSHLC
jgi:hypothetical protein